ncbi:MAG TPA: hypothetical protein VK175_11010 [Leadbetterella sp.]|nr:hypothetical protein [Leadbetterella sp.]
MKKVLISTFLVSLLIFSCEKNDEISGNRQISAAIDSEILVPAVQNWLKNLLFD